MKRFLLLTAVLAVLLASSPVLASFGRKAELPKPEEFVFADMPVGGFAYDFIVIGQSRQEAISVIRSFYNPNWDGSSF